MGELHRFFKDQEITREHMGLYADALRFQANRLTGYLSQHTEIEGVLGMGFPFYLPPNMPPETQINEIARYNNERKSTLSAESLESWECPSCFSTNELRGTRNDTCKGCSIEDFKPSDIQKLYMDLDLLCIVSGDEKTFQQVAKQVSNEMKWGLFPPLDYNLRASLSQYSAFVKNPLDIPPPLDLHFVRAEEFYDTVGNAGKKSNNHLHVLSAYESVKLHTMPFGLGSLFLTEPVLLNKELLNQLENQRRKFVESPQEAIDMLETIKTKSGQVRRMFSQQNLEQMLLEKMMTPLVMPSEAILVFGTTMPQTDNPTDLKETEALWRISTAKRIAQGNTTPILFTGIESEEMASALLSQDKSLASRVFIEPFSASTEENISNISFFEGKLIDGSWKGVSNRWHLTRIHWALHETHTGFSFIPYPIEEAMIEDGIPLESIHNFEKERYQIEGARIKNRVGYLPQFE